MGTTRLTRKESKLMGFQPQMVPNVLDEFEMWGPRLWDSDNKKEIAGVIVQIMDGWSMAEFRLGGIFFHLVGENPLPACDFFGKQNTGKPSHLIVEQFAESFLGEEDKKTFDAINREFLKLYEYRNNFAHGITAQHKGDGRKIALTHYSDVLHRSARVSIAGGSHVAPPIELPGLVFTTDELIKTANAIRAIDNLLNECCNHLNGKTTASPRSDSLLQPLMSLQAMQSLLGSIST